MSLSTQESACKDGFGPSGFSILAATSNTTSKLLENVLKTPKIITNIFLVLTEANFKVKYLLNSTCGFIHLQDSENTVTFIVRIKVTS